MLASLSRGDTVGEREDALGDAQVGLIHKAGASQRVEHIRRVVANRGDDPANVLDALRGSGFVDEADLRIAEGIFALTDRVTRARPRQHQQLPGGADALPALSPEPPAQLIARLIGRGATQTNCDDLAGFFSN